MLIIPAIDLYGGKCVRLTRGEYASARVYDEDPAEVARSFEAAGAAWIHIVDLDAARGQGSNREALRNIRRAVTSRLEVGGGIRSQSDVTELEEAGVDRLVLGTVLVRDPARVAAWSRVSEALLTAGIDARDGEVRVSGWEESGALRDTELAAAATRWGLAGIVYTSIARDGTLEGPDLARTNTVAEAGLPVVLSGGIGCESDVEAVHRGRHASVVGLITGKALYEGRLDLSALIKKFQGAEDASAW